MRAVQLPRVLLAVALTASWNGDAPAASPSTPVERQNAAGQQRQAAMRAFVFQSLPREKSNAIPSSPSGGQAEAFVGREDLYVGRSFSARPVCVPLDASPLETIVHGARATNIVIVNEHHASPRDRSFIADVLSVLKPEGYSIYAAETFSPFSADNVQVGWYSIEPIFARTVQLAASLGYSYVAYEQTPEQRETYAAEPANSARRMNARDESQATNLMAAIFTKHPDAKVIIHVGHNHVMERSVPSAPDNVIRMAERLKAMTGRDPLTITQTECNSPHGNYAVAQTFLKDDGVKEAASPVDLYIGHPRLAFQGGRPTWRRSIGDREVEVPNELLDLNQPMIVEARTEGLALGALPMDRVFLYPGERLPLLLPKGRYRVDGFSATGRIETDPIVVVVD